MRRLTYGNTNTFFIDGDGGGLLVDTGYAGTLPAFWKALKQNGLRVKDIAYVMATHYHPDHMGLIGELMKRGAKLLLPDVQRDFVHFSDDIFARDGISVTPVDETEAAVISCGDSRGFLRAMGISGEIIHTPSHSEDSVCLVLDSGDCFAGDLEPQEHIGLYDGNDGLRRDWDRLLSLRPRRIWYAHRPEETLR